MTEEQKAEAWCCKCKAKREFKQGSEEIVKTKRSSMLKGLCDTCGTKMCKILPKALLEEKSSDSPLLVQCPCCHEKTPLIDLREYLTGDSSTKMCLSCRKIVWDKKTCKKCRKSGCKKTIWVQPYKKNGFGEDIKIIHKYCEEHQKGRNLEFEEFVREEELRNYGRR